MRSQSYNMFSIFALSLVVENLPWRLPYYFSVLKPLGHHPYRNKIKSMRKGRDRLAHENMAGNLMLMGYPWIYPHRHHPQNGVDEVMGMSRPMVIEQTATVCKSIKLATITRMKDQYRSRRLIIPPQKMVKRPMGWGWRWMKIWMRLALPRRTIHH